MATASPDPWCRAIMAIFDQLPPRYRRFLAHYARPVPADQAMNLLDACNGDVDEAISEIRAHLPVRRAA